MRRRQQRPCCVQAPHRRRSHPPNTPQHPLQETGGASSLSSVATLCNSAVGAGVLSLPYAFRCAGLIGGLVLCFLVAAAEAFSLYVLSKVRAEAERRRALSGCSCSPTRSSSRLNGARAGRRWDGAWDRTAAGAERGCRTTAAHRAQFAERYDAHSYGSLVRRALGRKLSSALSGITLAYLYGSCVAYLVRARPAVRACGCAWVCGSRGQAQGLASLPRSCKSQAARPAAAHALVHHAAPARRRLLASFPVDCALPPLPATPVARRHHHDSTGHHRGHVFVPCGAGVWRQPLDAAQHHPGGGGDSHHTAHVLRALAVGARCAGSGAPQQQRAARRGVQRCERLPGHACRARAPTPPALLPSPPRRVGERGRGGGLPLHQRRHPVPRHTGGPAPLWRGHCLRPLARSAAAASSRSAQRALLLGPLVPGTHRPHPS